MPKIISNELRDMILKVYEFCKEEKNNRAPIIPFKKVNQRVCLATGTFSYSEAPNSGSQRALTTGVTQLADGELNMFIKQIFV